MSTEDGPFYVTNISSGPPMPPYGTPERVRYDAAQAAAGLVGHPEPTPDANKDLVYRVMQAIAGPPGKDEDVFLTAGEEVNIYALRSGEITLTADCSDFFSYATADAEPITAENVDLFEQCIRDLIAIDEWGGYSRLFCIRIRKQLPLKYHLGKAIPQVAELWEAAVSS